MYRARKRVRNGKLKLTENEHMNSQIHRKLLKESEKNGLEARKSQHLLEISDFPRMLHFFEF